MSYEFKFQKILSLKEREKDEAHNVYKESVAKFEEVAEKLYTYLKKKENIEAFQLDKLQTGLSVQDIRHHQQFIMNLEKTISYFQEQVMQARSRMYWYEEKLTEMNVEVKKYEKLKEKDFNVFLQAIKNDEGKQLDEVSVTQFMNRGIR
ncbi:flagellar export protein FliJ [Bacillus seohaeanensis]|jgi:flagellar protein FliJ|uniref:Flagellar FliJ protein n=1 Tax=Bacillus seohaeanensis TaxID=284580 RepID=A0ABW5RWT4_9BACI